MCTVSMVGDGWRDQFPQRWPKFTPPVHVPFNGFPIIPQVSKAEFDALKKEVEELKTLLLAAKKFDEATGQPNCETDDKVAMIKKIAEMVGVDLSDVFGKTDVKP